MSPKQTNFREVWLLDPNFSRWLHKVKNVHEAGCSICRSTFKLGNMGIKAVKTHMAGKKHSAAIKCLKHSDLKCFISSRGSTSSVQDAAPSTSEDRIMEPNTQHTQPDVSKELNTISIEIKGPDYSKPRGINQFLSKNDVTKAEIISCLQMVENRLSMRMTANVVKLDRLKYPDSDIAKKVQLCREKVAYSVNFGLGPFFQNELIDKVLTNCPYVVCFDESLNKVSQNQQMDLSVIFWDHELSLVTCRYFNSVFLQKTKSVDLLEAFKNGVKPLSLNKIPQVSMDGPYVNLKMLKELEDDVRQDPNDPYFLYIGTCGLHVLNNAFKRSFKVVDWEIPAFLSALYYVFLNSPARRGMLTECSGTTLFPLKFCYVRWLENSGAADRALEMLQHLHKFTAYVYEVKKVPTSKSFKRMERMLKDPMLPLKLTFFSFLSKEVELFLTVFQTNEPMVPFLFHELNQLLANIMERFVKDEVFQENKNNVSKIDLSDKNNIKVSKGIDVGLQTSAVIAKLSKKKVKDIDFLLFRQDAKNIMINLCNHVLEKSPLNYSLTRYLSSLDPTIAVNDLGRKRFKLLLQHLVEKKWVSGSKGESAVRQYNTLMSCPVVVEKCKSYSRRKLRIDSFYMSLIELKSSLDLRAFQEVLQLCLILAHSNAFVERGFSINAELLQTNLREESLIARRIIYDKIQSCNGTENVPIPNTLIHSFRNAHSSFLAANKSKEKKISEEEAKKREKQVAKRKIQELQEKKKNLEKEEVLLLEEIKRLKKV